MSSPAPSSPSSALSAFLRGVERRAAVMAELQCGDPVAGDRALEEALVLFCAEAGGAGAGNARMDAWPTRFWSLLVARPSLRTPVRVPAGPEGAGLLGALGAGPRAAVLLSLAAGLEQDAAAGVMGVAPSSYGLAVRRALAQLAGSDDPDALATCWRQLREQVHRRIKTLPAARQESLAQARARALAGTAPAPVDPAPVPPQATPRARPRWLMPALWTLLAVCALALLATFHGERLRERLMGPPEGEIWNRSLAEGEPPAARYDRQAAVLTHRDFELLANPREAAEAERLGFHAWLAAQGVATPQPGAEAAPARAAATAAPTGGSQGAPPPGPGESEHEPR